MTLKILKWTVLSLCALLITSCISYAIYHATFYQKELRQIKKQLNAMEGVTVANIWGHEDVTLEEISAALIIEGKGLVVLYDLNSKPKDSNGNLIWQDIQQIGRYSFTNFDYHGGVGPGLGKNVLESFAGMQLRTVNEQQDPIFNLIGIEDEFEFAKTLKWEREDAYYNEHKEE